MKPNLVHSLDADHLNHKLPLTLTAISGSLPEELEKVRTEALARLREIDDAHRKARQHLVEALCRIEAVRPVTYLVVPA